MKIYISADMEGIAGITHWDEATKTKADYTEFREQMTLEVAAACEGAINAGAKEIYIKDAHDTGRNLIASMLPENIKLIRGWSGHPFCMVQELDETFSAVVMIGYHSAGGTDENTLGHTLNTKNDYIKINGRIVTEFQLHAYAAALVKVPVVFISGDEGLCREVKEINENIETSALKKSVGNSTISIHPALAIKNIREGVNAALNRDFSECKIELPESFQVEVRYKEYQRAYRTSFYPGARKNDAKSVIFETKDFFEVLRFLVFF